MRKKNAAPLVTNGYRSGLEVEVAEDLNRRAVPFRFESETVAYTRPEKQHRFTPDFVLPNGIIVETLGRFVTADRLKLRLIKQQHPLLDIRLVFSNSRGRLSKSSRTTYRMWCEKEGFLYSDKSIPQAWLDEVLAPERKAAADALTVRKRAGLK